MTECEICLHGRLVRLQWDRRIVGTAVREVLRYVFPGRQDTVAGESPLVLTLQVGDFSPPHSTQELIRFEGGIRVWRCGERLVLGQDRLLMRLRSDGGDGWVHPTLAARADDIGRRLFGVLMLSTLILLRRRRLFPLHAAAVAHGGTGLLLVGDSDAGKSTLSYSLAREGWKYLSDDSLLLEPAADRVDVVPFRRHFGLDPEAGELFPELADAWDRQLADNRKWRVPIERIFPEGHLHRCRPDVLVFPTIEPSAKSRLTKIDSGEAMYRLAAQSALLTLEPDITPTHLDVLKRLIAQTNQFTLEAGSDLKDDPGMAADLLGNLLVPRVP